MSSSKSLNLDITINSTAENLSPVIDTTRLSTHLIRNHLYSPVSGTTPDFVADTAKSIIVQSKLSMLQNQLY